MAYCPECGEKVAEIDVFCPFCGISLQTVVPTTEDSFEGSPAATETSAETPIFDAQIPDSPNDFQSSNEENSRDVADDNDFSDNTEINQELTSDQNTSENWTVQTKSVDVPSELLNKAIITENPSNPKPETSPALSALEHIDEEMLDIDNDEVVVQENNVEINNDITEENIKEARESLDENQSEFEEKSVVEPSLNLSSASEFQEIVDEDSTIKENQLNEISTSSDEIQDNNTDKPDYVMTNPYVAPPGKIENTTEDSESSKTIENNSITSAANEFDEKERDEQLAISEEPIDKPVEELPEITYPPSKFDSVSIRESEDYRDEIREPADINSGQKPAGGNGDSNKSSGKENHSHTAPNLGGSDTDGKKRAKLQPLDEGAILNGRYEIVRKIGGGGMGAVYLASDKNLGGVLRAVKEMVQSYIEDTQQEKAVSDFKRESMLLTSLEHQSIPTIYDYFFDEKEARFYLVMKYISGGDLAARIRSANQGRIDEKDVTEWAIQIADVLDYLHNRQPPIVYRDLKPANIMIDGNSGRVMLIDFGIARWINKEEKGVTAVGTMGYAPPELFSGNVESRSDIYSLGSTMFHLLTGADPQSNPLLIFDFQKHPRPRQINPQLSDQMEKILMQSVEYNAENRFSTAASMRQTLEEHLANLKANKVTFGVNRPSISTRESDEPVFCGFCGQKIVSTDMFCAFCGAKQPLAQQSGHSEMYVAPPQTARLLIIGTNELETPAYKIEKDENLVGRRDPMSNIFPEVDLSKYDPQTKISRRHARIWREDGQFLIEDLGSSNGTVILPLVNETVRLLAHQPYTLTNGDKLRLGDTTLHFIIG